MKKFLVLSVVVLLASCAPSKLTLNTNKGNDDNALKVQKSAVSENAFKIIPGKNRVTYTINDRKRLRGLTLAQAKEKVLAEAVIEYNCAVIMDPNYSYDIKPFAGVQRITVSGYPAHYDFEVTDNEVDK